MSNTNLTGSVSPGRVVGGGDPNSSGGPGPGTDRLAALDADAFIVFEANVYALRLDERA
ncbi:hypothetical protein Q9Q95_11445 [Sphingomonas sp. DG1-23]|nr:hypothetical protein [Sphingomonas sp. DG1-23]